MKSLIETHFSKGAAINTYLAINELLDHHVYHIMAINANVGIWLAREQAFNLHSRKTPNENITKQPRNPYSWAQSAQILL